MKTRLLSLIAGCLSLGFATAQVPTDGLVAYYPLDNDTKDYSTFSNNGIATDISFAADRFGKSKSAAEFNGTSSLVTIPDDTELRPDLLSISVWVNPASKMNQTIVGKTTYATAQNEQYNLAFNYAANSNGVGFSVKLPSNCTNPGGGWQTSNSSDRLVHNEWQLLTSTFDGTTMKIYINTRLVKTATFPATKIANCEGSTLQLGSWWKNFPDFFQGLMDDVRIYNRALTADEIVRIYNDEPGLVAHYPLDGNANDVTPYANHGVMTDIQPAISRCLVTNESLLFNGTSSYITIPDAPQIRPEKISISVWVEATNKVDQSILGKTTYLSGQNEQYQLGINEGKVALSVKNPANCTTPGIGWNSTSTDKTLAPAIWHLITSTFDGSKITIYVDDQLVKSTAVSATSIANCPGSKLYIGTWWENDQRFFHGGMDDLKIYNRALSLEEVKVNYNKCPLVSSLNDKENEFELSDLTIYPNPSAGGLFSVKSQTTNSIFKIYNSQGVLIREIKAELGETALNLSNEPKGMYFLKTNTSNQTHTLVVQ